MLNFTDISPSFSQPALQLIADAMLISAKKGFNQAQPQHLIQILNNLDNIKPLLTKLGHTQLEFSQPIPRLKSKSINKVKLSKEIKKIIYQAYAEMLLAGHPQVSPIHFLVPINEHLTNPLDKKDIRQLILKSNIQTGKQTRSTLTTLEKFSQNLTQKAQAGKLDPVIGRDDVIRRVIQVLSRRTKNNLSSLCRNASCWPSPSQSNSLSCSY